MFPAVLRLNSSSVVLLVPLTGLVSWSTMLASSQELRTFLKRQKGILIAQCPYTWRECILYANPLSSSSSHESLHTVLPRLRWWILHGSLQVTLVLRASTSTPYVQACWSLPWLGCLLRVRLLTSLLMTALHGPVLALTQDVSDATRLLDRKAIGWQD